MPPDAVFPLLRRLFRLAYRPVAWYSNREEGSDPLSGISGPGTGVTESGEFPCRDERSDVCLHWNPPSRGPDAVFGGKRFPVTGIPGGMHDMERFLAYAFFLCPHALSENHSPFSIRQRYGNPVFTVSRSKQSQVKTNATNGAFPSQTTPFPSGRRNTRFRRLQTNMSSSPGILTIQRRSARRLKPRRPGSDRHVPPSRGCPSRMLLRQDTA